MDAVAEATAQAIVTGAKARVPVNSGKLRNAIHTDHHGIGEVEVIAGDTDVFYGHIVEHGGVNHAPHPFLTPAMEQARGAIAGLGQKVLRSLGDSGAGLSSAERSLIRSKGFTEESHYVDTAGRVRRRGR